MLVNINDIGGSIIRNDETYDLKDNKFLSDLVLSSTRLNPMKSTRGHSHENQEEIYFFQSGSGIMVVGDEEFEVKAGDIKLIKAGLFHRVINNTNSELYFVCVFNGSKRNH